MKIAAETIRKLDEYRLRRDVEAYQATLVAEVERRLRQLDPEFMADVDRLVALSPRWL